MIKINKILAVLVLAGASVNGQTYPQILAPSVLQNLNFQSFFPDDPEFMPVSFDGLRMQGGTIIGSWNEMYKIMPEPATMGRRGAFLWDLNSNIFQKTTNNPYWDTAEFSADIDSGRLIKEGSYEGNRLVNISNGTETLLSLNNPPDSITSFGIRRLNGQRVLGSYHYTSSDGPTGLPMPQSKTFSGTLLGSGQINLALTPEGIDITGISGDKLLGRAPGELGYWNSTGVIHDLNSGSNQHISASGAYGTVLTDLGNGYIWGKYSTIQETEAPGGGIMPQMGENRSFVVDPQGNQHTLAFIIPDQDPRPPDSDPSMYPPWTQTYTEQYINVLDSDGDLFLGQNSVTGQIFVGQVPEPSSLSLLLAGGAVLMAGRRRKLD